MNNFKKTDNVFMPIPVSLLLSRTMASSVEAEIWEVIKSNVFDQSSRRCVVDTIKNLSNGRPLEYIDLSVFDAVQCEVGRLARLIRDREDDLSSSVAIPVSIMYISYCMYSGKSIPNFHGAVALLVKYASKYGPGALTDVRKCVDWIDNWRVECDAEISSMDVGFVKEIIDFVDIVTNFKNQWISGGWKIKLSAPISFYLSLDDLCGEMESRRLWESVIEGVLLER